jgi:hypothetical protein
MRKCASCKQEADYIWQPEGLGSVMTFYRPGYHVRGFAAIPLCDDCKTKLETDGPEGPHTIVFEYRKRYYIASRFLVYATPTDDPVIAAHNRMLEELKLSKTNL